MKQKFIMMSVLIQGPKQSGNDIDVYLRPLVEEESQSLMKSLVKKKASRHKTKPPPKKLPYEKFEEESIVVAQKDLDNWWKSLEESKARRLELQKKLTNTTLHSSTRTKEKINEHEKKQGDACKPSPLLDYERSLDKSYKVSLKAKRARKDVAQLEQQSKQSSTR
jgi:NAD-specific glutamate dehydrogenase